MTPNKYPIKVNMEEILKESPDLYIRNIERHEDLDGNNEEESKRIISKCKYLGLFDYKEYKYKIYTESENDSIYYYLIHTEYDALLLIHEVRLQSLKNLKGIESIDIWQNHVLRDSTKKLGRLWVFNYILKNYEFIMSDKLHTPLGKSFWIKLIVESLDKKLKIIVYNIKDNKYSEFNDINDIEKFYGNQNKGNYRFVILK